jgi:hypothetical protein
LLVYQPLLPSVPVRFAELTEGLVASRLTVTDWEALLPALSVAEHVNVVPVVSLVTDVAAHPVVVATPEPVSEVAQLTCTSLVYQLFVPSVPVTVGVTVGGVLSTRIVTDDEVVVRPALSVVITRRSYRPSVKAVVSRPTE